MIISVFSNYSKAKNKVERKKLRAEDFDYASTAQSR